MQGTILVFRYKNENEKKSTFQEIQKINNTEMQGTILVFRYKNENEKILLQEDVNVYYTRR